jgi:hypothetical protein
VLDVGSHFFEFIPEEEHGSQQPTVLEAHELQEGRNYYILLTTVSGLYRYDIRDVVRCGGFHGATPLLEFLHKGASISNITGEKLTESQVVIAVRQALESAGCEPDYFTLSPVWGDPPRYRLHIEETVASHPVTLQNLAAAADSHLKSLNCEYQDKRDSGRLAPLECQPLPKGTWQRFIRHRQARANASLEQYKHPCLVPTLKFSGSLVQDFGISAVSVFTKAA